MIMKDKSIEFLNEFIEECSLDRIPESELRKQYIIYTVVESMRKLSRIHTLNNHLNETYYVNVDLQDIEVPDDYRDDCILCPPKYVRDEIIRKLDLENWQVRVNTFNNISTYDVETNIGLLLPDIKNNIQYMDHIMRKYGYYSAVKNGYERDGMYWAYVVYNPVDKFDCNAWIDERVSMLYHITSIDNANSIIKTGLKKSVDKREERIYLYANDWHDRDFIEMMLQSLLYKTKSSVAVIIPVRMSSTKEVTYYYDPNFSRGVFCTQDIDLKYIDLEGIIVQDLKNLI